MYSAERMYSTVHRIAVQIHMVLAWHLSYYPNIPRTGLRSVDKHDAKLISVRALFGFWLLCIADPIHH